MAEKLNQYIELHLDKADVLLLIVLLGDFRRYLEKVERMKSESRRDHKTFNTTVNNINLLIATLQEAYHD